MLYEDDFRKFNKQLWRIGSGKEWNITSDGLRLYAVHYPSALVWLREPMNENMDLIIEFRYMMGGPGHPVVILLSALGLGGATDTGYSIEFGNDANTHGIIRRLGKTVVDSPYGVISFEEPQTIKISRRENTINCWLNGDLVFEYADANWLEGHDHQYIGFGLGEHYDAPPPHVHAHGNSEMAFRYIAISQ
jgi:hypothetical protein